MFTGKWTLVGNGNVGIGQISKKGGWGGGAQPSFFVSKDWKGR